jgi:L-methionine (R)-S-oxide reductase
LTLLAEVRFYKEASRTRGYLVAQNGTLWRGSLRSFAAQRALAQDDATNVFMDKYTIFDPAPTDGGVATMHDPNSPAESARRDLDAALQLLAERAQYLTGASGASIALREGSETVCRASTGRAAPEVGVEIETDSGLIAESIRDRQVVRCGDADRNPRANRESCQELGVKSVMVTPLVHEQEVVGVFELVADRAAAFDERDVAALTRLAEMALTALEHADAAQRALPEISEAERADASPAETSDAIEQVTTSQPHEDLASLAAEPVTSVSAELARIGSCQACGFPVSPARTLCVDCEQAGRTVEPNPLLSLGQDESWLQAHSYTLGTLLIAALTLALLALKLR